MRLAMLWSGWIHGSAMIFATSSYTAVCGGSIRTSKEIDATIQKQVFVRSWEYLMVRGLNVPSGACPIPFPSSRDPSDSGSASLSCHILGCTRARSVYLERLCASPAACHTLLGTLMLETATVHLVWALLRNRWKMIGVAFMGAWNSHQKLKRWVCTPKENVSTSTSR